VKIGIVGSEAAKFTPLGEQRAKDTIRSIIETAIDSSGLIPYVVSGECHLGGIDIYAKDLALDYNIGYIGYPPKTLKWEGGYKQRNLQIAENSDIVYCLTINKFPENYKGMRFPTCYHCKELEPPHIKSGGCWTTKQARKLGKPTKLIIINNFEE